MASAWGGAWGSCWGGRWGAIGDVVVVAPIAIKTVCVSMAVSAAGVAIASSAADVSHSLSAAVVRVEHDEVDLDMRSSGATVTIRNEPCQH